jgi:hypothetical protein
MQPALVTPFHRPGWVWEEKVDGWRMLAYKDRVATSVSSVAKECINTGTPANLVYFAGSRKVARSVPTIVTPVNPPVSAAFR